VTVERHAGTLTNAREGARRLIEAIDGPCGVNWQPPFGTDADGIVADARRLAPLTNNVHLQAVPSRDARDRCPLAEAYFDVPACVDALREGGFDGVLEVEFVADDVPYTEAIARDLDYLRSATGSPGAR
jgi:sugar phosphate isomerase/epimerase